MDIVSHALIGGMLGSVIEPKAISTAMIFSIVPDLGCAALYIYYGWKAGYKFPSQEIWKGTTNNREVIFLYHIPHSFLFIFLFVLPFCYIYLEYWYIAVFSYVIHIIIDIYTHTGERSTKVFRPYKKVFHGYIDARTMHRTKLLPYRLFFSLIRYLVYLF